MAVQLDRLDDGSRHVTYVTEVQRMEGDTITLQNLFEFEVEQITADRTVVGSLRPTGLRPTFVSKFTRHGLELPPDVFGTAAVSMFGVSGAAGTVQRLAAGEAR